MTATLDIPVPRTAATVHDDPNGEITDAFGLVIVPAAHRGRYTALWQLIQARTRRSVVNPMPLAYAREYATVLARTGIDWTRDPHDLAVDPDARAQMELARTTLEQAMWAGRPLWWACGSWSTHAPMWSVLNIAAMPPEEYKPVTFADVWWLTDVLAAPAVHYDPRPVWSLCCAAPLCGDPAGELLTPAVLSGHNEDGDPLPMRSPERAELTAAAEAIGWGRRDAHHWLCPACVTAHTDDSAW
ncbi:hypothetical protein AB0F91_39865 [Amycolatopsis sp. NPDC023774]|uniref:hypothetical protein n=1 Tax=Amycolatopsis sp. NPDC023774 TaxID=3155015 RepID=UPI0033D80428